MIDDLQCSGNEWGLSQCTSLPWFSNNCGHGEDAGVDCYSTRNYSYLTVRMFRINVNRILYELGIDEKMY